MTISGNFERFQYFNFETDFLENENLIPKLEYRFSVESTKIEEASFPYKTVISESNVKKNRMVSKSEPITNNKGFPVTTLFF